MKILFLCTGNTCRSPMAEGIFNSIYCGSGVTSKSAGLAAVTGIPPSEYSTLACKAINIDISAHRSVSLEDINLSDYDLYVVMTKNHADTLVMLGVNKSNIRLLGDGIPDPFGGTFEDYISCRNEIKKGIEKLIVEEQL